MRFPVRSGVARRERNELRFSRGSDRLSTSECAVDTASEYIRGSAWVL